MQVKVKISERKSIIDNRVIEGRKMYHLDEKQIQEITDYIFLEDK